MRTRDLTTLAAALGAAGLLVYTACGSFGAASTDPASDAAPPPSVCSASCVTDDGKAKCGRITACEITVDCPDCPSGETCTDGVCACAGGACPVTTACGETTDMCGDTLECGGCDAGSSCQGAGDGGFACREGSCVSEPMSDACAGHCKKVQNNCAIVIPCGPKCPDALCGVPAATDCGCVGSQTTVKGYVEANHYHCYASTDVSCLATYATDVAGLWAVDYAELEPLNRCHRNVASGTAYLLTTTADCEGQNGFTSDGTLGYCSADARCGAVALYRYTSTSSTAPNDQEIGLDATAPSGYANPELLCYVPPLP